jgi:hypothetical protein
MEPMTEERLRELAKLYDRNPQVMELVEYVTELMADARQAFHEEQGHDDGDLICARCEEWEMTTNDRRREEQA